MIGAQSARRRINIVNDPVTPVFPAPFSTTSTNTLGGSGSFAFQFNATKTTASRTTIGTVNGTSTGSFQYFDSGALVDPIDYEVMVTLGSNSGASNIATAGGSATLGVWHTLSTSPLFSFTCSDRRGGSRPITVTVRHRVETSFTASLIITMTQSSDAVTPSFSGLTGTTTLTRTTAISYLGLYIDSDTSANAGRIRTYKNTTLDTTTGFTFSTGSIPESEYEARCDAGTITPGGAMSFSGGAWVDISTLRAASPDYTSSVGRFSATNVAAAGTGVMSITIRHKLDTAKTNSTNKTFETI